MTAATINTPEEDPVTVQNTSKQLILDKPDSELWFIHGKSYDLADYIDKHPGGKIAILLGKGRDCTELFESYHAMTDLPHKLIAKYEVRKSETTIQEPEIFEWKHTPFYDALKKRVREHFKGGKSYKCKPSKWGETALFSVLTLYFIQQWWIGRWSGIIGKAVFLWLGSGYMLHHGSHFSMSKNVLVNTFASYCGSILTSPTTWHHQHNIGHHAYTNVEGMDPDLTHFQHLDNVTPGYRLHVDQPWLQKYAHYTYAMLVQANFAVFGISIINEPLYYKGEKYIGMHTRLPMTKMDYVRHILGRLIIFSFMCVSPFFRFPFLKAVCFGFLPYFLMGQIFFIFSQVSHLNEHCFPIKEGERREWAVHQVLTTSDYATRSHLWRILSIGLNNQVPHHLFPAIDASHYMDLLPIIENTCKEFNVPYTTFPDWSSIFRKHIDYVTSVNDPKYLHKE